MALHERLASFIIVMALTAMLPQAGYTEGPSRFSDAEIESLLAPVALYPDTLLTQILIAATYPLDVVEAARFMTAHPELEGSEAVLAVARFNWDPSVQALTAFPEVLARMDADLRWTSALGDAFLQQQEAVMVSLQTLRRRARLAGTLEGSEHLQIEQRGERLVLEAPSNDRVYVPWYDTTSAYGEWPSRQHQPVYWAPTSRYQHSYHDARRSRSSLFWAQPIHLDPLYFPTRLDWHRRGVIVVDRRHGKVWKHGVKHDRGGRSSKTDPRHQDRPHPDSGDHSDGYAEYPGQWQRRSDHSGADRHWERNRGQRSDARSWPEQPTASLSQRRVGAIDTRTASERLRALQAEAAAAHGRPERHRSSTPHRRFEDPGQNVTGQRGSTERRPEQDAATTMTRQQRASRTRAEPSPGIRNQPSVRTASGATTGRGAERSRPSPGRVESARSTTTNRSFGGANQQRGMRPATTPQRSTPAPTATTRQFGRPGSPPRRPD